MSYEETVKFLALAFHSFNPKYLFDQIIIFALKNKIYDPMEVNLTFEHYGLKEVLFFDCKE